MSGIGSFVQTPLFGIALTLAVYACARLLYDRTGFLLLHPVLVSIVVIVAILEFTGISYNDYMRGGSIIVFFLGPAVVALGLPLYEELVALRRNAASITAAILFASVTGIVSAVLPALLLGSGRELIASLAPKSVTTPIAMEVARGMGGIPPLTASVVVLTGVFGAVVGPLILRAVGVVEGIAFGLALGAASHGIGTARAVEQGGLEGAASSLALCLNGIVTSLIAPPLVSLLLRFGSSAG
ncbi:LrgB family protein [Salinispira pacifica]